MVFAQNNTITFRGKIANRNGDVLFIREKSKVLKEIQLSKDGTFKDSFEIKEGMYEMFDGVEFTEVYLKNGYDLELNMDAKKFDESIVYKGNGSVENNYLAHKLLNSENYNPETILTASEIEFNLIVAEKKKTELDKLESAHIDPNLMEIQKSIIEKSLTSLQNYYKEAQKINKLNNTVAPAFDYYNYKGKKTTKLSDFKGKYVYIDVWATWCGPCRAEIPALQKIAKKYRGKNIEFVSISIDTDKDKEKWKTFVKEKKLSGVQLFADKNWNSDFVKAFGISAIPRFILIDPTGKVVKADAARPSSLKLQEDIDKLLSNK
jgi:thiol-disulfide isomerase/thioredoxin